MYVIATEALTGTMDNGRGMWGNIFFIIIFNYALHPLRVTV